MNRNAAPGVNLLARIKAFPHHRIQLVALAAGLAVVLVVSVFLALRADFSDAEYWKTFGYPGVLIVSFLGSSAVVFPVPGLVAVCGASSLELNPLIVALLGGVGETAGEIPAYGIGYGGRSVVEKRRMYQRVRRWMQRRGSVALFLVSLIPNPIFDVVGVAAGGTNFPMTRFLVAVLAGKTLKSLAVAYACFYGVRLLPWGG